MTKRQRKKKKIDKIMLMKLVQALLKIQMRQQEQEIQKTATAVAAATVRTITPLSDGPRQEHFLIPLNPQPRSIASMPAMSDSDSDLDPLTPESSHDARWRRQNRITSYREFTWPVTNSRNVMQTQDPETLHLEKQRRDAKRLSDRAYLQRTGRDGYGQY